MQVAKFNISLILLIVIEFLFAVFIASRDLSIGTDTFVYAERYKSFIDCFCFNYNHELGFQLFSVIPGLFKLSEIYYFFLISITIFLLVNLFSTQVATFLYDKNANRHALTLLILALLFLSPFFVSAHINAIRQGLSSLLVIYSYFLFFNKRWVIGAVILLAAVSIHLTAVFYVLLAPFIFLKHKWLLVLTISLSFIYLLGGSELVIEKVSYYSGLGLYDSIKSYQSDVPFKSGVRYDFLLFSWFWPVLSYIIYNFIGLNEFKEKVLKVINVYYILLTPFLLFGFANFSNRYAYPAWLFAMAMMAINIYLTNYLKLKMIIFLLLGTSSLFYFMIINGFAK